ncbi:hypothetical protein OF83DRAFT_1179842 [Amylostereum chailletii]|nr:hypothetical protein OF83DRAFT_1179842 [Amylostereum chailletii]
MSQKYVITQFWVRNRCAGDIRHVIFFLFILIHILRPLLPPPASALNAHARTLNAHARTLTASAGASSTSTLVRPQRPCSCALHPRPQRLHRHIFNACASVPLALDTDPRSPSKAIFAPSMTAPARPQPAHALNPPMPVRPRPPRPCLPTPTPAPSTPTPSPPRSTPARALNKHAHAPSTHPRPRALKPPAPATRAGAFHAHVSPSVAGALLPPPLSPASTGLRRRHGPPPHVPPPATRTPAMHTRPTARPHACTHTLPHARPDACTHARNTAAHPPSTRSPALPQRVRTPSTCSLPLSTSPLTHPQHARPPTLNLPADPQRALTCPP